MHTVMHIEGKSVVINKALIRPVEYKIEKKTIV